MISTIEYCSKLSSQFKKAGDPEVAQGQMKYMRHQFEFFGCKAPVWAPIVKQMLKTEGMFRGEELKDFIRKCFQDEHREMHYAGLQMLEKQIKYENKDYIHFLEKCILMESWWDTVDWISKLVGWHFKRFPELQYKYCEKWISSEKMWLQRVAIIHQLPYKENTDEKLLFSLILRKAESKEFFIQKACGWALRNYSRVNKRAVEKFISGNQLPSLTVREGMRLIKSGRV